MVKKLYSILSLCALFAGAANAQTYCTPSSATTSCLYGMGTLRTISLSGATGTIYDTLGCVSSGYVNRTSMSCTLNAGSTYSMYLTFGSGYQKNIQVWVDFNNDGSFDTTETIGGGNSIGMTTTSYTLSLAIPTGAAGGSHRMRIISDYASTSYYPHMNPCRSGSSYYGEVRDYSVTIGAGCTGTPTAGTAGVSEYTFCGGSSYVNMALSGSSSTTGLTYQWQYSTDGVGWYNLPGAVSASYYYYDALRTSMYYRAVVSCGSANDTSSVDSLNINRIAGHISYSALAPDTTTLKVWLIEHDTATGTLTAIDSVITCNDSVSGEYYEFNGMAHSSNYLVKARCLDATSTMVGASGYVPTYGYSNSHWDTATVATHGSDYDSLDIVMLYGTVPSGPGFIGGTIVSGAGKGTAGDIAVPNLLVLLENTATHVLTQAYTNASGVFSFSGIAYGSYIVHPEYLGYTTTAATVTLSSTTGTINNVNFRESTTYKTIRPFTLAVLSAVTNSSISVHPNPANNELTLSWNELAKGNASVVITDVTGRVVLATTVTIANTTGKSTFNIAHLSDGVYFVKVNAGSASLTEKVVVKH